MFDDTEVSQFDVDVAITPVVPQSLGPYPLINGGQVTRETREREREKRTERVGGGAGRKSFYGDVLLCLRSWTSYRHSDVALRGGALSQASTESPIHQSVSFVYLNPAEPSGSTLLHHPRDTADVLTPPPHPAPAPSHPSRNRAAGPGRWN